MSSDALFSRYVVLVASVALVTMPKPAQEVTISAGKNGPLFGTDTAALSAGEHVTIFTKLQAPTVKEILRPHTILYGAELMH